MAILWVFGTWITLTMVTYMVFFATAWLVRALAVMACAGSAFSIGLGVRIVAETIGVSDGTTAGTLAGVAAFILSGRHFQRAYTRARAMRESGGEAP